MVQVSVILPTYNRARTLAPAMRSVLDQSATDLELIVVDDGSREDVESVVRGVGDPRVRFIRHAVNAGAGEARNTGVLAAEGRFVAFQDSDDLWLPGKLERQLALFATLPPAVGVVTGPKILYGRDESYVFGPDRVVLAPPPATRLSLDEDQYGHLLTENRISLQNALFRRDVLPPGKWFDSRAMANEDWEFAIRLTLHTRIHEDAEPVVLGFVSPDSISKNNRKQTLGIMRIMRANKARLGRYPDQRSQMLVAIARELLASGRRRQARHMLAKAVRDNPRFLPRLVGMVARVAARRLGIAR